VLQSRPYFRQQTAPVFVMGTLGFNSRITLYSICCTSCKMFYAWRWPRKNRNIKR